MEKGTGEENAFKCRRFKIPRNPASLAEEPPFRNENDFREELSNEMPAR